jgi:hypothetical protein
MLYSESSTVISGAGKGPILLPAGPTLSAVSALVQPKCRSGGLEIGLPAEPASRISKQTRRSARGFRETQTFAPGSQEGVWVADTAAVFCRVPKLP